MIRCYHVVDTGAGWVVRREGCPRETSRHADEASAIAAANALAAESGSSVLVHDRAGRIRARADHRGAVTRTGARAA